jgi:sugar/nucleoside kinase (ribokinase family)
VVGDVINDILVETAGPVVDGEDNRAVIQTRPGGSAANQAAWLGWLGVDVVFAGRAGALDVELHRRELERFGVSAHLAADPAAATGSIVVLVGADGERTMITDRGANLRLQPADVPAALLDGVDLLHLTGYSLFEPGPRSVARQVMAEAAAREVPFGIDPASAAFLRELAPGAFLEWTRGAAVCFPNRDEAEVLAGGPAEPSALAGALVPYYGAVVVKLGASGSLVASRDGLVSRFPAHPAVVRDTTGAGDAFCAGFLAGWLRGQDVAGAVDAGAAAAALAVSTLGGRPYFPGGLRPPSTPHPLHPFPP